jgi:hypothetical protein
VVRSYEERFPDGSSASRRRSLLPAKQRSHDERCPSGSGWGRGVSQSLVRATAHGPSSGVLQRGWLSADDRSRETAAHSCAGDAAGSQACQSLARETSAGVRRRIWLAGRSGSPSNERKGHDSHRIPTSRTVGRRLGVTPERADRAFGAGVSPTRRARGPAPWGVSERGSFPKGKQEREAGATAPSVSGGRSIVERGFGRARRREAGGFVEAKPASERASARSVHVRTEIGQSGGVLAGCVGCRSRRAALGPAERPWV